MIPIQMELGGKDACIVCHDADIDLAAKNIVKVREPCLVCHTRAHSPNVLSLTPNRREHGPPMALLTASKRCDAEQLMNSTGDSQSAQLLHV